MTCPLPSSLPPQTLLPRLFAFTPEWNFHPTSIHRRLSTHDLTSDGQMNFWHFGLSTRAFAHLKQSHEQTPQCSVPFFLTAPVPGEKQRNHHGDTGLIATAQRWTLAYLTLVIRLITVKVASFPLAVSAKWARCATSSKPFVRYGPAPLVFKGFGTQGNTNYHASHMPVLLICF